MITAVIVDDEPNARQTIREILKLTTTKVDVLAEAGDVASAFELIRTMEPRLVFLDINLPDGNGFDLLNKFEKIGFKVIFITAHDEYAIRAFRCSALDYILKPVIAADLITAVEKAAESISQEQMAMKINALLANLEKLRKIILKTAESIHIINIGSIIRCEADVNYTHFHLDNGRKMTVSKPLKDYAEVLENAGFFRTHQSHLVNLEHVLRYDKSEGGHIVMDDGSQVPVSTRKKDDLFRLFEEL
jgi:two-component system, LytTR family, response regulator